MSRSAEGVGEFVRSYAKDLTSEEFQRLFTHDTPEAYRFFARGFREALPPDLPWHRRLPARVRLLFLAFSAKLSPARRALYGLAVVAAIIGLLDLWDGLEARGIPIVGPLIEIPLPLPSWPSGTLWLVSGFLLLNLLILLETADRLSLKNDLEVAREIQLAMLPAGTFTAPGVEAHGLTRPANTVGGDFYDILPLPDGRVAVAVGDVAGKGSPASLLMALLLAVLRTLLDEGLDIGTLIQRLNVQVSRHAPGSRFVTLFFGMFDPRTGLLSYVNAGHLPPLVFRHRGGIEHLSAGGMALGIFEGSRYEAASIELAPGDLLVLFSDGITEAEDPEGRPFEEAGLTRVIEADTSASPAALAETVFNAVAAHARDARFQDDLTLLALRRLDPAGSVAAPLTSDDRAEIPVTSQSPR